MASEEPYDFPSQGKSASSHFLASSGVWHAILDSTCTAYLMFINIRERESHAAGSAT